MFIWCFCYLKSRLKIHARDFEEHESDGAKITASSAYKKWFTHTPFIKQPVSNLLRSFDISSTMKLKRAGDKISHWWTLLLTENVSETIPDSICQQLAMSSIIVMLYCWNIFNTSQVYYVTLYQKRNNLCWHNRDLWCVWDWQGMCECVNVKSTSNFIKMI